MGFKSLMSGFGIRVPRVPGGPTWMATSVTSSCLMGAVVRRLYRPVPLAAHGRVWHSADSPLTPGRDGKLAKLVTKRLQR
jgi:hypothetical protein